MRCVQCVVYFATPIAAIHPRFIKSAMAPMSIFQIMLSSRSVASWPAIHSSISASPKASIH